MEKVNIVTLLFISLLASGCGSKWVKLDNSAADSDELNSAKAKCQVEDKLYKLSYQETATEAAINSISDEASKEDLRKGFEMKEQKVYEEIEACMQAKGLKSRS